MIGDGTDSAELLLKLITGAADHAGVGITATSTDGDVPELVYSNAAGREMLGYDEAEFAALKPWDMVAPEELGRLAALFAARRDSSQPPQVTRTTLLHRSGRRVAVEVSSGRVRVADRVLDVSFVVDVGERTAPEEELQRSERRLRSFIDNAPDGILMLRWPRILFINDAAVPMLGFRNLADAQGQDIRGRLQPAPVGQDAAVDLQQLVERPREVAQFTRMDAEGSTRYLEISSIPTEYEGQPAVLAFVRDVTERNEIMTSMVEADKLAAVGGIAAGVAHEINNPLAYVMLNLEFLSRELPKLAEDPALLPQLERRLVDIRQGTERVKTIVRDLQTFTRKEEEIRGPVELESVIDNAMHLARHEIRHRARLVRRIQMVPPVHGNATRLEQLFLNLLVNAAHALGDGDPASETIEVSVRHTQHWVVVEVTDSGCGMSEEERRHAFDAFFTTKPQGVGTGLGLAICQGIVRGLGGEIEIDSELGRGTTVRVLLKPDVAVKRASTAPPPPITRPPGQPRGRILLVDDEVSVAESLGYAIREHHDVDIATSAAAARAILTERAAAFDVVLCDLVMPGESGMDLYDQIARDQPALCERFVFMTGGVFLPRAEEFLARVDNPHIEKPFDLESLARLIEARVSARRSATPKR